MVVNLQCSYNRSSLRSLDGSLAVSFDNVAHDASLVFSMHSIPPDYGLSKKTISSRTLLLVGIDMATHLRNRYICAVRLNVSVVF